MSEVNYKLQIRQMQECAERRNRQLDALHYVWCDGGCKTGVHRWSGVPLTEEIVLEAEANTRRLRQWWVNKEYRLRNDKERNN